MPDARPFVLVIRDGWGHNPHPEHDAFNAVTLADTPVSDRLMRDWPSTLIATSSEDVGLPDDTMGNSEVGHQNIGAGRIVDQESVRISKACRTGELNNNAAVTRAIESASRSGGTVHLFCIASDAGVHGLLTHLYACVEACKHHGLDRVALHLFTDGRDTGPFTGAGYIEQVETRLAEIGVGRIATLCGRFFAMDRDNRWERVKQAYDLLTGRDAAPTFESASAAIQHAYEHPLSETQKGDEFVTPCVIGERAAVTDGDSVIFVNYRGDRPREITRAFRMREFHGHVKPSPDSGEPGFDRGPRLELGAYVTMTSYETELEPLVDVAFPRPPKMHDIGGAFFERKGLTQFRCAETEKYPHVTFFFNDYRDEPFDGERRENPQSPKVPTYDLAPEMSAEGVCQAVLNRLGADDCEDVIIVNFANGDMVGHTGNLDAAIKACEFVDACVGRVVEATLAKGGCCIVTADHGNAEQMFDPNTGSPHTAHTVYDVPMILLGEGLRGRTLHEGGRLADIIPTGLALMGLEQPAEMTGRSLLV